MCIIAVKPAGLALDLAIVKRCWEANPHGAGLAWRRGGRVEVRKGFMRLGKFERFLQEHKAELTGSEVIMHFRIASVGEVSQALCHPFGVGRSYRSLFYSTGMPVVFHNGHIMELEIEAKVQGLSDTAVLVRDYLTPLASVLDKPEFHRLLEIAFPGSKFAIMTPTATYLVGRFERGAAGWHFSNGSWRGGSAVKSCALVKWAWDWDVGEISSKKRWGKYWEEERWDCWLEDAGAEDGDEDWDIDWGAPGLDLGKKGKQNSGRRGEDPLWRRGK